MTTAHTPSILVDIGNTRIKWGFCPRGTRSRIEGSVSLPPTDERVWASQRNEWLGSGTCVWVVSGVHPERVNHFKEWIRSRHDTFWSVEHADQLPLSAALEEPGKVGIDRLLNAVAANTLRPRDVPVVIADIGSAVTVDWIDENGVFKGGAIFPGLRLMAKALNDYTALLPLVELSPTLPELPGTTTRQAIEAGLTWSTAGGVVALADQMSVRAGVRQPFRLVTGGDSELLHAALNEIRPGWRQVSMLTLEGLRLTAEAKP